MAQSFKIDGGDVEESKTPASETTPAPASEDAKPAENTATEAPSKAPPQPTPPAAKEPEKDTEMKIEGASELPHAAAPSSDGGGTGTDVDF